MEMSVFAMQQSPVDSLIQDIEMFGRGIRRLTPDEFEQHKTSVRERFNNLSPDEQQMVLQSKPRAALLIKGMEANPNAGEIPHPMDRMPGRVPQMEATGGRIKPTGFVNVPGGQMTRAGFSNQIGGIANLQRRFQPPMQQQGGPSLMARLENVDNNVQQIARQLGVQNQPQRPNLPSAMQTMQGPPQGILALLQQRQQQVAQADPLLLQQNQLAAQSRLQPRYNPQAQMLMQQQAVPSQALRALQSRQAYRGLAAGPFAFSMRR